MFYCTNVRDIWPSLQMLSKQEICTILLHEFKLDRTAVKAAQNAVKAWENGIIFEPIIHTSFKKIRADNIGLEDERGCARS